LQTECSDNSDEANCPLSCNFENGYCNWVEAIDNTLSWSIQRGTGGSSGAQGPGGDTTTGLGNKCYCNV